jgi:hypothetical protein
VQAVHGKSTAILLRFSFPTSNTALHVLCALGVFLFVLFSSCSSHSCARSRVLGIIGDLMFTAVCICS